MSEVDWCLLAWRRAFDITGRSRRKEFAYFLLVAVLGALVLFSIGIALGSGEAETMTRINMSLGLYFVAITVPKSALTIRRLHDVEMSGWFFLLGLVPVAGLVLDAFCLLADSNPRPNKWGVSPKFETTQRWMASEQKRA
jgi:uncharacterized membrane protein YhaH (DUF805 family)